MTYLTSADLYSLSPLLVLLGGALLLLLLESFASDLSRRLSFLLTLLTLTGAAVATAYAPPSQNPLLTPWIRFDSLSRLFTLFFIAVGAASAFLAAAFFRRFEASRGEYYFLLLSAVFGLVLIGASADFLTLFLGIETLSVALYISCCYMRKWENSYESALKYFLMGALAAGFLLYGVALIYGAVGTTQFSGLLRAYHNLHGAEQTLFLAGIALVTLGIAFEAAIVPFHVWAPDVYAGAPNPVTAFMSVGTKVGAFAAFVRVFFDALPNFDPLWNEGLVWLAYATLIYANFVALQQTYLRRFFAYSGISHAGFMLIPLIAGTPDALPALLFYIAIYAFATLGSFAVFAFLDHSSESVSFLDLQGLFRRAPFLAGALSLCLLTLAGIPPTAGFFAKFYLFKIAYEADYIPLLVVALLTTVLSAFYYLRIVGLMFSEKTSDGFLPRRSWPASVVGIVACAVIILLSCYPAPLSTLLEISNP